MKPLSVVCWEFVQNLPLVTGFLVGWQLWRQNHWLIALACMITGSVVGALTIRATEARKVKGHQEPLSVTIANISGMTGLTLLLTLYLLAAWSSWWTDLLVGALAGSVLSVVQDVAAKAPTRLGRHALALACACPVGLLGVRITMTTLSLWASILVVTVVVTLVISWIDYIALLPTRQSG